jgi:hypothetical protein
VAAIDKPYDMNGCYDEKDSRICLGDDALVSVRFDLALSYRKSREELGVRQSFPKPDLTSRSNDLR